MNIFHIQAYYVAVYSCRWGYYRLIYETRFEFNEIRTMSLPGAEKILMIQHALP